MPDLTPERVWEIVEPVWEKHPETRMPALSHEPLGWMLHEQYYISPDLVALLCVGRMVEFLSTPELCVAVVRFPHRDNPWTVWTGEGRRPESAERALRLANIVRSIKYKGKKILCLRT